MSGCPHLTPSKGSRPAWWSALDTIYWRACNICEVDVESPISDAHALACLRAGRVVESEAQAA